MNILYHGSTALFDKIDPKFWKSKKDFGKGFYTTEDINKAREWAIALKNQSYNTNCKMYLYSFGVDIQQLSKELNVHTFKDSIAWLDYIVNNRSIEDFSLNDYDIVIGKIADARTQVLVESYCMQTGGGRSATNLDKKELLGALLKRDLKTQICFKSDKAIAHLQNSLRRKEIILR